MLKQLMITLLVISAGCQTSQSGSIQQTSSNGSAQQPSSNPAATLKFSAPSDWTEEKPSSSSRVAQYKLAKTADDTEDASAILYFFGQGQGGGTAANIERWVSQMQQPEGGASKDKAKEESLTVNGLKITTVDVTGTYTAEMAPGSGTFHNNANYRMRAAVIETPKGSYYLKVVGPAKTMAKWDTSITNFVNSVEFK